MTNGTVVIEAKPWYQSLTILFNVVAALLVLAEWAIGQGFAFTTHLWFTALVAVVNFALRFRTVRPVAASSKPVDVARLTKGAGA